MPATPRTLGCLAATLAAGAALCAVLGLVFGVVAATAGKGATAPVGGDGGFLGGLAERLGGGDGPAEAGFRSGRPVGLWLMTRFWMATGSLEVAAWYFTPDGRVYVDPEGGFDEASLAAHGGEHGTVDVSDRTMTIQWASGETSSNDLERDEESDGFGFDGGLFQPVTPFADPSQVVGRWEGGHSVRGSGGYAATARTLDLAADGTFTWDSAAFLSAASGSTEASAGATGAASGSWQLSGFEMELRDAGGNVARGVAFPYDDTETAVYPDRFYFRGTMYKRLAG